MGTKHLKLNNNSDSGSVSERIELLQSDLNVFADAMGFVGAIYFVNLSKSISFNNSLVPFDVALKKHDARNNFLFSNDKMRRMRKEFTKKAIKVEPNRQKIGATNFQIFSYEGDGENVTFCRQVLDKYDVRSRVYCCHFDEETPNFYSNFLFMSDHCPDDLRLFTEQNWDEIYHFTRYFHNAVIASRAVPELNPLTGLGLISDRSINVLRLVSDGCSRPDIAKSLYLTERGVDYHVEKLKVFFDAKNNAQLVACGYKYKLLS